MEVGSIVRFLNDHPWLGLAAGAGIATVSVLRLRRERQEKRGLKSAAKEEKLTRKAEKKAAKGLQRLRGAEA